MGYIDQGQFHLLFHAGSPLGPGQVLGEDVPQSFVPLDIGGTSFRMPRKACTMSSDNVREIGVQASTAAYAYLLDHAPRI